MYSIIKAKPWLSENYKPKGNSIWHIPTMITKEEKLLLSWLAEFFVKGNGQIVDLGSFLGGSTAFLAHGLSQNKSVDNIKIHCYDVFYIPPTDLHVIDYFFPQEKLAFPTDGNILPIFKKYTKSYAENIIVNKGRIEKIIPSMDNIELLFVDLMKSPISYDHTITHFIPKLVPGKSIMILQDYLYKNSGPWHAILMELLDDYFDLLTHTSVNSVVYSYKKKIPRSVLRDCLWDNIDNESKIALLEKAKLRWSLIPHIEIVENQINNLKESLRVGASN